MQLQETKTRLTDSEFLALIQEREVSFYRVAYGYVRNQEDAKDIVQEAVCKAYMKKGHLRDREKFYPWFYRILTNTAISFSRRAAFTVPWDPESLDLADSGEEERLGDAVWVNESLKGLDAPSRTVIVLKIYESMTFPEIAQILKKRENTVKSMYYRGLKFLKERM